MEITSDRTSSIDFDEINAICNNNLQLVFELTKNYNKTQQIHTNTINDKLKTNKEIDMTFYLNEQIINDKVSANIKKVTVVNNSITKCEEIENVEQTTEEQGKAKSKSDHIISELISTEEDYIQKLEFAYTHYEQWLIENIGAKNTRLLFKNLSEIIMESKVFLEDLRSDQFTSDCDFIGKQIVKHKSLFHLYTVYCRNQKSAEMVYQNSIDKIKEREIALDDKLGLHTGLLRPVQRLAKYEMLLKELQRAQDCEKPFLSEALEMIQDVSQKSNNVVELEHLLAPQNYNQNLQKSQTFKKNLKLF